MNGFEGKIFKSQNEIVLAEWKYIVKNFITPQQTQTYTFNDFDKFEKYYNSLETEEKKFCEFIPYNRPVKEFYDIDYNLKNGEKIDTDDIILTLLKTRRMLGRDSVSLKDIVVLSCHRDTKFSLHLIFNTDFYYKSNEEQKEFVSQLKQKLPSSFLPNIDLSVYNSNSLLRILGSVKIQCNQSFISYRATECYSSVSLKKSFIVLQSDLGELEGLKPFEKYQNEDDEDEEPQDDEEQDEWLDKISLFKSCADKYEDWVRVVFSLYNLFWKKDKNFCNNLIHTFSKLNPKKYNYREVNTFISNIEPQNSRGYKLKNLLDLCKEKKITRGSKWIKELIKKNGDTELVWDPPQIRDFPSIRDKYFWTDFVEDVNELNKELLKEPIFRSRFLELTYRVLGRMRENWIVRFDERNIYKEVKSAHLPIFYCEFLIWNSKECEWERHYETGFRYLTSREVIDYLKSYTSRCFSPIPQPANMLNTWTGFKAEELKIDQETLAKDLEPLLYHIKEVICSGDQILYDYFLGCWFKTWFNDPSQKLGVIPVLIGTEGSGKSTLPIFLMDWVVGNYQCGKATAIGQLTDNYNGIMLDKMFIFLDEIENIFELKNKDFEAMKSLITDKMLCINIKFQEKFMIENYTNFMITTNNEYCLKMSKTDRRYFILNPSNKHRNEKNYFDKLYSQFNQETGNKFFTYCKNYEPQTQGLHLRRIPMTSLKEEMVASTESSLNRYLIDVEKILNSLINLLEDEEEDLPINARLNLRDVDDSIRDIIEKIYETNQKGYKPLKSRDFHHHYIKYCEIHGERKPSLLPKFTRETKKTLEGYMKYNESQHTFRLLD